MAAGFVDFEITWQVDVFSGAPQASSAAEFGTQGINFRARKAANEEDWHVPMPSQMQETKASESLEML